MMLFCYFFFNREEFYKFYLEFMRKLKSIKFFKFGKNDGVEFLEVRVERVYR